MTQPSVPERLSHMLDAARTALEISRGKTRDDLDRDVILQLALTRLVEIIGEAAKNVPDAFRNEHPTIPWKQIAGARDWLAHAYFRIDLDQLWTILSADLPSLVSELERLVPPDA